MPAPNRAHVPVSGRRVGLVRNSWGRRSSPRSFPHPTSTAGPQRSWLLSGRHWVSLFPHIDAAAPWPSARSSIPRPERGNGFANRFVWMRRAPNDSTAPWRADAASFSPNRSTRLVTADYTSISDPHWPPSCLPGGMPLRTCELIRTNGSLHRTIRPGRNILQSRPGV